MKSKKKTTRTRYSEEFKTDALACADRLGVAAAAREMGLHASQLYDWRLKRELADRDEELALLKKASAYFARNQK